MGTLGSLGLVFYWMGNPNMPDPQWRRRKLKDSMARWNAIAAASNSGLGLLAAGAPLKLLESLSSSFEFRQRRHSSQDRCGHHSSSEQHWTKWLQKPLSSSGGSKFGGLPTRSVEILFSQPWQTFSLVQRCRNFPGRGTLILAGIGGGAYRESSSGSSDRNYPSRNLTNLLLGLNVLMFWGQMATRGRLLLWGAKVNTLINQGQYWRLLTPTVLHANIFHLLVNAYSLNSIGPTVESLAGPKRFLAVYSVSALASTSMSYFCCAAPSVGASGAIFGLVGALAVFIARHRSMMVGGQQRLQEVARVIAINMALGLVSDGIDNWSHLGGLLGGAAVTWLVGPKYTFELPPGGGQTVLIDRPPISYLRPSQVDRK